MPPIGARDQARQPEAFVAGTHPDRGRALRETSSRARANRFARLRCDEIHWSIPSTTEGAMSVTLMRAVKSMVNGSLAPLGVAITSLNSHDWSDVDNFI